MAALPVKVRNIWKTLRSVQAGARHGARILIVGREGAGKRTLQGAIGATDPEAGSLIHVISAKDGAETAARLSRSFRPDLALHVFSPDHPPNEHDGAFAHHLRRYGIEVIPVLAKADLLEGLENALVEGVKVFTLEPDKVVTVSVAAVSGLDEMAVRIAKTVDDDRLVPLGAGFLLLREAAAKRIVGKVSTQNGILSGLGFAPGADIAALTANQIRMVLEIAAIYGEQLSIERAREVAATIGGGFLLRAVARQLLGFIPIAGWAVKSGVAYAGTQALGRAAIQYFAHPEIRSEAGQVVRDIIEAAKSKTGARRNEIP